ncbi:MAG: hypothetical protein IJY62_05970 [Clostridia bacterium]|nr:hypothetical protein [Clostridia bacterium]
MRTVYQDADFKAVYLQRKRILGVFWGVLGGYLLFSLAWLIYYISLPYEDPMQKLPKACVYIASFALIVFAFPFMGIKFNRVRKYYRMMYYLSEGLKSVEENYFVGFEKKELQKDYVDVISAIFKTWNQKKQEWMVREAYVDVEKPLPEMEAGDLVKYVTQGNFIVQYEIIERGALAPEDAGLEDFVEEEVYSPKTEGGETEESAVE